MELFSGISRGSYLVCIGWITLIVSDDVARVGQIFIVAMMTNIVAGPLVGVVVDRYNRKSLVIAAHLGIGATLSILACRWFYSGTNELGWMFVAVVSATALRLLHNTALDGLIQGMVATRDLTQTVARCRTIHLLSTVVGTLAAGSVIERASPGWGLLFSASASVLLVLPMIGVRSMRVKENAPGFAGLIADISAGFDVFRRDRRVRLVTMLAGVSFPVGQLSNAILSSFIRDDLGQGSEAFEIVDSAWPMGACWRPRY